MNFDNKDVKEVSVIAPAKKGNPKYPNFPGVDGIKFVQIKKDTKGGNAIIFKFQSKDGGVLEHREFEPNKIANMSDDDFIKSAKLAQSRVAHIARAYLTEAQFLAIKGSDWNDYIKNTVIALGIDANGVPTRAAGVEATLKVVLRESKGKYYSSLPKVPPFISTANHPKEFTLDPKYDIMEIPSILPDTEKGNEKDLSRGFETKENTNVQNPPEQTAEQATAGW
jgi:hypothetical protein